jgi:hypothetical protein
LNITGSREHSSNDLQIRILNGINAISHGSSSNNLQIPTHSGIKAIMALVVNSLAQYMLPTDGLTQAAICFAVEDSEESQIRLNKPLSRKTASE